MNSLEWTIFAISIANVALAAGIGWIYWRNHRSMRSSFTWVLVVFAVFLILHNAFQVYKFLAMMGFGPFPETLLAVEGILEFGAGVALLVAAMR